jgi:hypothetical protein
VVVNCFAAGMPWREVIESSADRSISSSAPAANKQLWLGRRRHDIRGMTQVISPVRERLETELAELRRRRRHMPSEPDQVRDALVQIRDAAAASMDLCNTP